MLRIQRFQPLIFTLALLAGAFGTARAGRKIMIVGDPPHPLTHFEPTIQVGPRLTDDPACDVGNVLTPVDDFDYFDPTDGPDIYYTLIEPGLCDSCPPGSQLRVDRVRLSMWFPAACTQPVDISFVGMTGPASCPRPDENNVIAGPFHFDLPGVQSVDATGAPLFDLSLPTAVVLPHRAFLAMSITSFGTCNVTFDGGASFVNTKLVYGDTTKCDPCENYNNYYDSSGINRTDYCVVVNSANSQFRLGPPIQYVSGTCGQYVPVMPMSWGQLKIRYSTPRRRRRRVRRGRDTLGPPSLPVA
jgi:hypothetical protein